MKAAASCGLVAACAAAGAHHAAAGVHTVWYARVEPPWAPPRAVFPVVWTTLYAGLAYALATETAAVSAAAQATQLVLGVWWCRLFFRARRPALAAVVLAAMVACSVAAVATTHTRGARVVYGAAYIPWCVFALVLNIAVVQRDTKKQAARVDQRR